MPKRPHLLRPLLLVTTVGLTGCGVSPQASTGAGANYRHVELREMSGRSRAAIKAKSEEAASGLSIMDAHRAAAARASQ